MNNVLFRCGFSFLFLCVAFPYAASDTPQGAVKYSQEIEPYVSFLKEQRQQPVDYVMELFKKHDIVILCERHHGETMQYDFILDLISDTRFIAHVGNVFTEVGTSSMRGAVHDFLFSENLTEREIENKSLNIYRNLTWFPMWEKHNFFDFLKRLYSLNNSLKATKKVNLYFSDMPFSWERMTQEKYREFKSMLRNRDRIIAKQVIEKFNEISRSGADRKKALVIMNYRHAFNDRFEFVSETSEVVKGDNVGRHIFEAYPGKVANVMMNFVAIGMRPTGRGLELKLIQDGKWDAAFQVADNPNLGFDFADSPFGKDSFDYFVFPTKGLKYQDVFTGFVFYKPLEEHRVAIGIPGLFDNGYDKVILERLAIFGKPYQGSEAESLISRYSRVEVGTYKDMGLDMTEKGSWLTGSKCTHPAVSQEKDGTREKSEK